MTPRLEVELGMLRTAFPGTEWTGPDPWVRVPGYRVPPGNGWNRDHTDMVFRVQQGHPATPPKDIYVPAGLQCRGQRPGNYSEPAQGVPFPGLWGAFSWGNPEAWTPRDPPSAGSTLLNFVRSFADRLREGP
jgi:hypothetical protein